MPLRIPVLLLALLLSGCHCLVPVVECEPHCKVVLRDGGSDGGLDGGDAGAGDGGSFDAGVCALWSEGDNVGKCAALTGYVLTATQCKGECVLYPIVSPGVFPSLGSCVACGCDPSKLMPFPPGSGMALGPETYCDELVAKTTLPRLIEEAFPGIDAGCQALGAINNECTVWISYLGDAGYARACATTLIPYVTEVDCRVFVK